MNLDLAKIGMVQRTICPNCYISLTVVDTPQKRVLAMTDSPENARSSKAWAPADRSPGASTSRWRLIWSADFAHRLLQMWWIGALAVLFLVVGMLIYPRANGALDPNMHTSALLNMIDEQATSVNQPLSIDVQVKDPSLFGNTITYVLESTPNGSQLDPHSGEFTFAPQTAGEYTFHVRAVFSEHEELNNELSFSVSVSDEAEPEMPEPELSPSPNIYRRLLRSAIYVVVQRTGDTSMFFSGSGCVVNAEERLLITNHHVIEDAQVVHVAFPDYDSNGAPVGDRDHYVLNHKLIPAEIVHDQPDLDLALIRVDNMPGNTIAIELAPQFVEPSDDVHTIGNPGASLSLWNYTEGSVRSPRQHRVFTGGEDGDGLKFSGMVFEITNLIGQGDSGGPVVNDKHELVGIVCGAQDVVGYTVCLDVDEVKQFLSSAAGR
jgi:S1-C subfamily serine protease